MKFNPRKPQDDESGGGNPIILYGGRKQRR